MYFYGYCCNVKYERVIAVFWSQIKSPFSPALPLVVAKQVCREDNTHTRKTCLIIYIGYLAGAGWGSYLSRDRIGFSFISVKYGITELIC